MPALVCAAQTCIYNTDEYCSKGDIKIGGSDATNVTDTCCASFEERRNDSYGNQAGTPCERIDISCEACNCVYNDDAECTASQIGVAGASASECRETACGTFTCE